jgi:hypothetical protein
VKQLERRLACLLGGLVCAAACKPDLGSPPSLITEPTILAVRGRITKMEMDTGQTVFAEAQPGEKVVYDLLVASPEGTLTEPKALFSVCLQPKPPAEGNSVSTACVTAPAEGTPAASAELTLPGSSDACSLFGPITPESKNGGPKLRPRDPDSTGGYYVPVRVLVDAPRAPLMAFALTRITCGLAGASSELIAQWNKDYHPNQPPRLAGLALVGADGTRTPLGTDAPATVRGGSSITLEAQFADDASETFPWFDPSRSALVERRESLSLSWFMTAGELVSDRTGRAEGETSATSSNSWTLPFVTAPTPVHVWLVLRDSRGGVDFLGAELSVSP